MPKNIVICCDATFLNVLQVSNVFKLYSVLEQNGDRQIAFYHPGIAAATTPTLFAAIGDCWRRVLGLGFGYGHIKCLVECYSFVMEHYAPGDLLFIFGFSRGAYTARSLAALLHMCGLIQKGNGVLIPQAIRFFAQAKRESFLMASKFKGTFSRECKTHFVGVWDTASTVGWLFDPVKFPYTSNNPDIVSGRHAVAIDERRNFFRPNLWGTAMPGQDLKQVWFSGVLSDVGGGYAEEESGLSKISLEWMIHEARSAGLLVTESGVTRILGQEEGSGYAHPDPTAVMHRSLHGFWWQSEFVPRRVYDTTQIPPRKVWQLPRGRRRYIPEGSLIHESVFQRMQLVENYDPPNLPKTRSVERRVEVSSLSAAERYVNTWLDVEQNEIEQDVWYEFNINIGPRQRSDWNKDPESPAPEGAPFVEVMVTLFSQDFDIEPRRGTFRLFAEGSTSVFHTRVKARHSGPCRIEIVVTSVNDLDILQRATSEIVVGDTEPATLYARN
jgi:hypothetical protein